MRILVFVFLLVCSASLGSCTSAPRADAEMVQKMHPVACRLALTVSQAPSTDADANGLRLTKDTVGLRDALVAQLSRLNTASVVFGAADRGAVKATDADMVLDLKIAGSPPKHQGMSSGWWASGLLWAVTWIGGLFTNDSTYATDLTVTGNLAQVDSAVLGSVSGRSGEIDLNYFDRNTLLSWRGLQSLVLPPFWTGDDPEITSEQLTTLAAQAAAVQVADYIKRRMEDDAGTGFARLTMIEPANNGVTVSGSHAKLHFAIESKDAPVSSLVVSEGRRSREIAVPGDTGVPGGFRCEVKDVDVELRPGDNLIQIQANIGGRRFARTLRLRLQD